MVQYYRNDIRGDNEKIISRGVSNTTDGEKIILKKIIIRHGNIYAGFSILKTRLRGIGGRIGLDFE